MLDNHEKPRRIPNRRLLSVVAAPRTSKAGVAWQPISEAPEVNDKPPAKLRQMKELVKRFSATILVDGNENLKQEMRQLTSPIHRYADPDAGLTDGAIFGFSTNGTNPDVLLVIEAASSKDSARRVPGRRDARTAGSC